MYRIFPSGSMRRQIALAGLLLPLMASVLTGQEQDQRTSTLGLQLDYEDESWRGPLRYTHDLGDRWVVLFTAGGRLRPRSTGTLKTASTDFVETANTDSNYYLATSSQTDYESKKYSVRLHAALGRLVYRSPNARFFIHAGPLVDYSYNERDDETDKQDSYDFVVAGSENYTVSTSSSLETTSESRKLGLILGGSFDYTLKERFYIGVSVSPLEIYQEWRETLLADPGEGITTSVKDRSLNLRYDVNVEFTLGVTF